MTPFRTLGLIAAATVALALPAYAYWNAFEADDIHDRHAQNIVDELQGRGIKVERLEEWSEFVIAFVVNEDGSTSFQYFDPDNGLKQVHSTARF